MRGTVPPSAEIEAQIERLLAVGVGENPRESLSELARLGARLIIQRAVEDEFDAWLGRARYEKSFTAQRGGDVTFDAGQSLDPNPGAGSGIDPAAATWDFNDGTAPASGQTLTHTFRRTGTVVGTLRVRDRAGNTSDPRTFSITVEPGPPGVVGGITGYAAFTLSAVRVHAQPAPRVTPLLVMVAARRRRECRGRHRISTLTSDGRRKLPFANSGGWNPGGVTTSAWAVAAIASITRMPATVPCRTRRSMAGRCAARTSP